MTPYLPTQPRTAAARGGASARRIALIAVGCALWLGLVGGFGAFQWSKFSQLQRQARRGAPVAVPSPAASPRSIPVAPSNEPAPAELEAQARAGDTGAALRLARLLERRGAIKVALEWRLRAAELGDAVAMAGMAQACRQGVGVARDAALAASWTERAIAAGDADLWHRIGNAFQLGVELPPDAVEAAAWHRRAAAQDHAGAKAALERLERGARPRAGAGSALPPLSLGGSAEVFDLSKLDTPPRAVFQRRPQYPFELRRRGVGGEVVVDFLVDRDGSVRNAHVIRATTEGFGEAAVEAVSAWRFEPGRKNGAPVITHMQVPIVFTLNEEPAAPRGRTAPPAPRP